jgi:hypothetical protein
MISLLSVIALALSIVGSVCADTGLTGAANTFDPNQMTQTEKNQLAIKIKMADSHMKTLMSNITPATVTTTTIYVGGSGAYREPNQSKYVNYCVPSSSQVAIIAKTSNVPTLDAVALGEKTDPKNGTYIYNVPPYLNPLLKTSWYTTGKAANSSTFASWLSLDIDSDWSLMTLLKTGGNPPMPGWTLDAQHYVATYGYIRNGSQITNVYYVDTASVIAGYDGNYFNNATLTNFWYWITRHPAYGQVW